MKVGSVLMTHPDVAMDLRPLPRPAQCGEWKETRGGSSSQSGAPGMDSEELDGFPAAHEDGAAPKPARAQGHLI